MKQDKQKTKVLFLLESNSEDADVFAFFPDEHYHHEQHRDYNKIFSCYAHIGQHSGCHVDYAKECIKATPDQYNDLKIELESIGYNLHILNQ